MYKFVFTLALFCSLTASAGKINLMSYNVENLFDPTFESEQKDWTFMPKAHPDKPTQCNRKMFGAQQCLDTDWTEAKLNRKLTNLAKVITSRGSAPEILALVEIEDQHVINRLAQLLGYKNYVITNSPNLRGVNVALLYKETADFEYVGFTEHDLNLPEHPSRNILEVEFRIAAKPFIVFVNHWPSQAYPVSSRFKAAKLIKDIIDNKLAVNPETNIILVGDFNTTDADRPDPFQVLTYGSENRFIDVDRLYRKSAKALNINLATMPLGSFFYERDLRWTLLDHVFINNNLVDNNNVHIDLNSYKIVAPEFAKQPRVFNEHAAWPINPDDWRYGSVINNTPVVSNFATDDLDKIGYSDHFAVSLDIIC